VMLALAALAATGLSCAQLGFPLPGALPGNIQPPALVFQGVTLARAPAAMQLAAYYCPDVVSAPLGSAGMIC